MEKKSKHGASIANSALKSFAVLIGRWKVVGTHPEVPDTVLHGLASFKWIEGGAFMIYKSEIDFKGFPKGIAIFGSDDTTKQYFMLYFDERKVSRKYDVTFQNNVLKWWRHTPNFSQEYSWTFSEDGNTIISKGKLSKDGTTWEDDLNLTYTRI